MEKIIKIDIGEVKPSPMNPRKTFDKESLQELSDNIKRMGLLQPITVRPIDPLINKDGTTCNYEIVCGERRYRAVKMAGAKTIAAVVREMSDEEAFDAMITENLQRKDVDPIEEAFAFSILKEKGKSAEEIALRFGKSQRYIVDRIKLDGLIPELKKKVSDGEMDLGAAIHISKLKEDEQRIFLRDYGRLNGVRKSHAEGFTNRLFKLIEKAIWHGNFEGSCKTTCAKCRMNSANVGCLFYEMEDEDPRCTARDRYARKSMDWMYHVIDAEAGVLVRQGEKLEKGKTLVTYEPVQYNEELNTKIKGMVEVLKGKGYRVEKTDDLFLRYSHYDESDKRLKDKIERGEVYRVVEIYADYSGLGVTTRYYEFADKSTAGEDVEAMNLVAKYNDNESKMKRKLVEGRRNVFSHMNPEELSREPLTKTESLVLLTAMLKHTSYEFRQARKLFLQHDCLDYARKNLDQVNLIARDFIRTQIIDHSLDMNDIAECQELLGKEWCAGTMKEVEEGILADIEKKQSKIRARLAALGYGTDGKRVGDERGK